MTNGPNNAIIAQIKTTNYNPLCSDKQESEKDKDILIKLRLKFSTLTHSIELLKTKFHRSSFVINIMAITFMNH